MKRFFSFILFLFVFVFISISQENTQMGSWTGHFPFNKIISVANDNNELIYAATEYNIFSYNKTTGEIIIKSKLNGLSDIGISCIDYNNNLDVLVIAYKNSNIDLIKNNKIINIPDIYNSNILVKKTINNILFKDDYAYLSCGFGIVVVDLKRHEIKDTYLIGENNSYLNIYDMIYNPNDDSFHAATDSGLYVANNVTTANLSYSNNWQKTFINDTLKTDIKMIELFNNDIYICAEAANKTNNYLIKNNGNNWEPVFNDNEKYIMNIKAYENKLCICDYGWATVFDINFDTVLFAWIYGENMLARPNKMIIDNKGSFWVADNENGLVNVISSWENNIIRPTGPLSSKVFNLRAHDDAIYILGGGFDASWVPLYNAPSLNCFVSNEWKNLDKSLFPFPHEQYDLVDIAVDPRNPNHYYLASYTSGLIEVLDNEIINIFNSSNSPLESPAGMPPEHVRIGGLKFDKDNNLWITNSFADQTLKVLLASGKWGEVNLPSEFGNTSASEITIDNYGQKWLKLRDGGTIFVIDDNGTPDYGGDDRAKALNYAVGNGNIQGLVIHTITNDLFGDVWIGTDQGVSVFYYPERIFTGENFDAERIIINNEETANQPLLANETVTKIYVDFNNNKWISTSNTGVYYVSPHGTKEILHFDKDNSFLLSNNVQDIAINSMGEVFFSTNKGLCSYRNYTSKPKPTFDDIYAYPNPVRPDYTGPIAITGLKTNSHVRITDMEGKAVFTGISDGGQILWDGTDGKGNRASSGVYVVFAISLDTKEKATTKILFIK